MDEFAHILQRDYGLKPMGKAAPMSSGAGTSAGSRAGASLEKGKSGSTGSGTGHRSRAAAAVYATGDNGDIFMRGSNGKPPSRNADPAMAFGSAPDDVSRGPTKYVFSSLLTVESVSSCPSASGFL